METTAKTITVKTEINAPTGTVWEYWTQPEHITQWNQASPDWCCPSAENDLVEGGKFSYRMEAKDGSLGFDLSGSYDRIVALRHLDYTLDDGRKVQVHFMAEGDHTKVTQTFEPETTNSLELQQQGWQAILDSFKQHVETHGKMDRLHYETMIDAPPRKVYDTMLDEKGYAEWTQAFNGSSHYRGSWSKGDKIIFIGCDAEGKEGGMVSRIKENIPAKFVSIEHLGLYMDGQEITSGKEVEGWAGALENYTFEDREGKTLLSVDMDANEEFRSYFEETWPKALERLKEMCEK